MIARDAVNYVIRYTVSDTESLRKVHVFVWPEAYDGAREERFDSFSGQDLPQEEAAARIAAFLEAAKSQSTSTNPAVAAAASDAAARLQALVERKP